MSRFETTRDIPATVEQVFAAIAQPARLARWWGPAGFTNTFEVCEFKPGGRWSFTMHGPDGQHFPNESMFAEIVPPNMVVVQHVSEPRFRLTISLTAVATGTRIAWVQEFEQADLASKLAHIVVPANEQNLDRLTAEVAGAASA